MMSSWMRYMVVAFVLVATTQAQETTGDTPEASSNQFLERVLEYIPQNDEIKKYWNSRTTFVAV